MKSRKVKAYNARHKPGRTIDEIFSKKSKADLTLDEDGSDDNADIFHDEIDDVNNEKDDELSTDDELINKGFESSDEEEVLPITDDEKDESEDNHIEKEESEEEEDDYDLPNREAWGKKKSAYYSADFVDEDRGRTYREEDAEAAKAEAEEAFAIQKSVYSNIVADNLGANLFLEGSGESSDDEEEVDLVSATKEEKLKYLRTETQILEVSKEFKSAIQELKKFSRLVSLIEAKKIKSEEFEKYIRIKNGILSLYCLNLSLYMMFASSNKNIKYHPVVQRMSSYKQLLEDLKPTDSVAKPVIDELLEKESRGEEIEFYTESEEENLDESNAASVPQEQNEIRNKEKRIQVSKVKHMETENEKQVVSLLNEVRNEMRKRKYNELNEDEDKDESEDEKEPSGDQEGNTDKKRVINYQIAKNKGLVPHRKKEYRNPRVRHRMKYRKAQIRRKGQVRGVYKEIKRYEGEPTGINTNVVKSIKFK